MPKKYGLLSDLQLLALYYKSRGYTLREAGRILNTSHQNVAVAYRRALRNIELAEKTLLYYRLATAKLRIIVPENTHLADIPRLIIERCDAEGIKLRADVTLIFKMIRFYMRNCVSGNIIVKPLMVLVMSDGSIWIYPYDEINKEYMEVKQLLGNEDSA